MKRNRKVKKYSRSTVNSVNTVALIVLSFFALMVYWSQDARCTALTQEIGRAEQELRRLDGDCQREASSWDELKSPGRLAQAFIRHGIDMGQANPEQVIHMGKGGLPEPGQMSVARIRARQSRMDRMAIQASPLRVVSDGGRSAPPRVGQNTGKRRR